MLPNFIVIGAAKCGTSSICHLLGKHPDVFMSTPKEIHYFGHREPHKTPSWYASFFKAASEPAIGEGSTSYTHPNIIEQSAAAIAETIPDCRLIYLVRNPIKRLESDWKMRYREGWTADSINAAVLEQQSLISHGMYWSNINVFRSRFPDQQILILFLEDLCKNPQRELNKCFRHIGVDSEVKVEGLHQPRNRAGSHRDDRFLLRLARSQPFFHHAKNLVPERAKTLLKGIFTRKHHPPSVEWDTSLRDDLTAEFRKDARQLLQYCHKDPDYWHFE
ncbi:sulfotransferase domain-containing protein [Thiohalomonas denitrificans]|uniref:sulfotransferase domain-containing protein n=1 Tax=Thiohalomonas denitrificans TaxID=415747 RepID=UPI0026EE74C9|nr:sulfotransferase domain-containing protein [Thiohalomonas denitrificans]